MVVRDFPFYEERLEDGGVLRSFSDVSEDELVWHRDREDRIVECIKNGGGWMIQMENQLPEELVPGTKINITKNEYHRVIKGDGQLCVKIWKLS